MAPATTSPHSFSHLPLEGRSDPSEYLQRRPPLSSQKHAYRQTLKGGKERNRGHRYLILFESLRNKYYFDFLYLIISLSIQYYFQNVRFFFIALGSLRECPGGPCFHKAENIGREESRPSRLGAS